MTWIVVGVVFYALMLAFVIALCKAAAAGDRHLHDTDSLETGWCSGCGRTDLADNE